MIKVADMIVVTDWDKVGLKDDYLSKDWLIGTLELSQRRYREIRKMAKDQQLYDAWIVKAVDYAIYVQMDAQHIIINKVGDEVISCESDVIGDKHQEVWKHDGY